MDTKNCRNCGKPFTKRSNVSRRKWLITYNCSSKCGNASKRTPWLVKHQIQPGQSLSAPTQFQPGQTAGINNTKWKGDQAGYHAIHLWVSAHFGRPQFCENCGRTEPRMYHWANISGSYTRERDDWIRLCVPCHKRFDLGTIITS